MNSDNDPYDNVVFAAVTGSSSSLSATPTRRSAREIAAPSLVSARSRRPPSGRCSSPGTGGSTLAMLPDAGDQLRKLVDDAGAVTETDHIPAGFNPSGPQPLHNRRSFMPINGFEADDLVVCAYRLPSPIQPWVGGVHVGRVLEPGDDPADWNGHNSERDYCQHTNRVPVAYCQDYPCGTCQQEGGFQQHDDADALTKIGAEQAALPVADKIRLFLGEDALAHYRHACGPLSPDAEGGCHEPYRPVR